MKLSDIPLPAGYSWNPVKTTAPTNVAITGAGTYTYTATYTPDDTTNYHNVTGDFTVVINHASSSITGLDTSYDSWTYNNADHKLSDLLSGIGPCGYASRKVPCSATCKLEAQETCWYSFSVSSEA